MGTNYDLYKINYCVHCSRHENQHVGKQSCGWPFLFNPYKKTAKEWFVLLRDNHSCLKDEYGRDIEVESFIATVIENQKFVKEKHVQELLGQSDGSFFLDEDGFWFSDRGEFC